MRVSPAPYLSEMFGRFAVWQGHRLHPALPHREIPPNLGAAEAIGPAPFPYKRRQYAEEY